MHRYARTLCVGTRDRAQVRGSYWSERRAAHSLSPPWMESAFALSAALPSRRSAVVFCFCFATSDPTSYSPISLSPVAVFAFYSASKRRNVVHAVSCPGLVNVHLRNTLRDAAHDVVLLDSAFRFAVETELK